MAHITASVSHGASPSGDWREPWDVHQTPRANNWLLPTIKINQNAFPKTGAADWDKWHQLILKIHLIAQTASNPKCVREYTLQTDDQHLKLVPWLLVGLLEESGLL